MNPPEQRRPAGAIKDGRIEVAAAIASASSLVSVDPSTSPYTTVPAGLSLLTFDSPQVAMDDSQMRIFKRRLRNLLPEIGGVVDLIAEDAGQRIAEVERVVMLALGAGRGPG